MDPDPGNPLWLQFQINQCFTHYDTGLSDASDCSRIVAVTLRYVSEAAAAIRVAQVLVQSDRYLRFALIPRDIVGLILEYVPNTWQSIAEASTVIYVGSNYGSSEYIVQPRSASLDVPDLGYGDIFDVYHVEHGVLHLLVGPAEILNRENAEYSTWSREGIILNENGPAVRRVHANTISYALIPAYLEIDYGHASNDGGYSMEEWRRCRDVDHWPLPCWYKGPR